MTVVNNVNKARRRLLVGATSVVGLIGVGFVAVPFLGSWMPSEQAKAVGGPIEIDISKLPAGAQQRAVWRGKAIYVIRMTDDMIKSLDTTQSEGKLLDPTSAQSVLPKTLRDKKERSIRKDVIVLIGVCTHLGCAPMLQAANEGHAHDADWLGGFYCPCHGSKFDYSGRVYKGVPAPINLAVPAYKFVTDNLLIIGEEGVA